MSLNDVGIYLGDGPFKSDIGINNLHPKTGSHWILNVPENFFDSYGCSPPQKLSKFIIKPKGHCLISGCNIHGLTNEKDSYCGSYCLFILVDKSLRKRL